MRLGTMRNSYGGVSGETFLTPSLTPELTPDGKGILSRARHFEVILFTLKSNNYRPGTEGIILEIY